MVSNINTQAENKTPLVKDKKTQTQEAVKKEQENFSKLIQEKVKNTDTPKNEEKKSEKKSPLSEAKQEAIPTQNVTPNALANNIDTTKNPVSKESPSIASEKIADTKTLGDVKKLAEDKELNLQNMELQKENISKESSNQKQESLGTQNLLEQKKQTNLIKTAAISQPLAQALKEISSKDKEIRKTQKPNKLEYQFEGKTEKIAVIQRGKTLPKSIVESKMRNERREMAYQKAFDRFGIKNTKEDTNIMQEALQIKSEDKKKSLVS